MNGSTMPLDLAELRQLAETCIREGDSYQGHHAYIDYLNGTQPATLLALLDRLEGRDRLTALNEKLIDALAEKGLYVSEDGRECFIDGCGEMDLVSLKELRAERDNLRRLLALLWQRVDEPREGDVPEGVGLYTGHRPRLSAAEFREIGTALKEGKG